MANNILVCHFNQDDPRKCTAEKLCKFKIARKIRLNNIKHIATENEIMSDVL